MEKKQKTRIIVSTIMFVIMAFIAFISVVVSTGLVSATETETEDFGEALGVVFAIIILIVPLLACAVIQLVPGIINIVTFSKMNKYSKDAELPKIKTYSIIGLVSSIVLTAFPIILAIVTILVLQAK